jgi:predicted site-specific integrase-resolvase
MDVQFISGKKASAILGVKRFTLYKYEKEGLLKTIRSPGGKRFYNVKQYLKDNNIIMDEPLKPKRKICYARVSSYSQKKELENQKKILKQMYPDYELLYDIGSGINFKRKNFIKIINYGINNELEELVITYKDRLCRIGYDLLSILLKNTIIRILYDCKKSPEEEVVNDLIEILTVFSERVYGLRSYKKNIITNKKQILIKKT